MTDTKTKITATDDATLEVEGTVAADVFDRHYNTATNEFVSKTEIKGFRKGKAPEDLVIKQVGEQVILERAIHLALSDAWPSIVEEHGIEAISRPEFQIMKVARGNPLEWKARVATLPEITLPDYKTIASETKAEETKPLEVTEKEIDEALEWVRKSREKDGALPELNDEFAKSLGNFENLEALRKMLKSNIESEKRMKERERVRVAILKAIREKATFTVPEPLVNGEQQRMLSELKATVERIGKTWEDYKKEVKKSDDEILAELKEEAERRASFSLLLQEIAKDAEITVTDEEITTRVEGMLAAYPEEQRKQIDQHQVREYAYGVMMNDKVFALLEGEEKSA